MELQLPIVYPITDSEMSGLSLPDQLELLIKGGARFVQLREKNASPKEFYSQAASAIEIAKRHHVMIIINDRVDIAMLAGADGVHLGQDDLSPVEARRLLGHNAVIGFSTHTLEQAEAALELPVDYIAFGPVFPTSSKINADPVVGLRLLSKVKKAVGDIPLVAIGGINEERLSSVLGAGADSAAVISSLMAQPCTIPSKLEQMLGSSLRKMPNIVQPD